MKKSIFFLCALLSISNAHATIISSDTFSGGVLPNVTITTTIDDEFRVVTYSIVGLQEYLGQSAQELDFSIDTRTPFSTLETDPIILRDIDHTAALNGQSLFRNGLAGRRFSYFAGVPEVRGPATGESGLFAIKGTDGTFSKKDQYLFGIVYDDAWEFTGNFISSNIQINSEDYVFAVPELSLVAVPLPPGILLLLSGLLTLFQSKHSVRKT